MTRNVSMWDWNRKHLMTWQCGSASTQDVFLPLRFYSLSLHLTSLSLVRELTRDVIWKPRLLCCNWSFSETILLVLIAEFVVLHYGWSVSRHLYICTLRFNKPTCQEVWLLPLVMSQVMTCSWQFAELCFCQCLTTSIKFLIWSVCCSFIGWLGGCRWISCWVHLDAAGHQASSRWSRHEIYDCVLLDCFSQTNRLPWCCWNDQ